MNSDRVRKDCFKVGNALTFRQARDMARSEESADKQLQLMNTDVHYINTPKGYQGQRNQRQTRNMSSGKSQASRNCGWGPHSREQCPAKNSTGHYCHKVGHLAKVCLSKLNKISVHEMEATSDGQVSQYYTLASHRVTTCFWAQLVQHPWLAVSMLSPVKSRPF